MAIAERNVIAVSAIRYPSSAMDTTAMAQRYEHAPMPDAQLVDNVGIIADRLVATCRSNTENAESDMRELLEQALIVAVEQQLAAQSKRLVALEQLSFKDELTGLHNRRGFDDQLERTLAVASRHGGTGVLAFIDLDNFKTINDELGHRAGDAVLRHVAELLAKHVRTTDVVARIGGDEFTAILVQVGEQDGLRRAAALELLLNAAVVLFGAAEIPVHASLGVATFGAGDEAADLVTRADAAMYRKKQAKPPVLRAWRIRRD